MGQIISFLKKKKKKQGVQEAINALIRTDPTILPLRRTLLEVKQDFEEALGEDITDRRFAELLMYTLAMREQDPDQAA